MKCFFRSESEALSVCLYVCNILTPLPSLPSPPLPSPPTHQPIFPSEIIASTQFLTDIIDSTQHYVTWKNDTFTFTDTDLINDINYINYINDKNDKNDKKLQK